MVRMLAKKPISTQVRGMLLIAAALAAKGTSTISNARQVDRGYEDVDLRLARLGAKISRRER